ncbi:MAG: PilZ domain-containing protein, partial [Ignavibacteriales bacterium]
SMIDCSYILDTPESSKQLIKTRMLDLGAGGCKLEVSELMETGDPVKVAFTLTADDTMAMNGTVIRVLDPKKEGDPYQVAIQFLDVKEGERDQIVRWAYKHELNINEEKKRLSEGLCLGCGKPLPQDPDGEKQTYCVKCTVYGKR